MSGMAILSSRELLSTIESTLLASSSPSATQRVELMHALKKSFHSFQSLLSFPPPKQSDRLQVQSKEVRVADSVPVALDSQDVQIALKLSDDLHLNEFYCVHLLVSANERWGLMGREPVDILRLSAGLWYTERRDLLTALYILFRAVVLDQGYEDEFLSNIQTYLEGLLNKGLRKRMISLIKDLNLEEPCGVGGIHCESHVLDDRGAIVDRRSVVHTERLILVHCLVLSCLIVRISPDDAKDIFGLLKDNTADVFNGKDTVKLQISNGILFSLVISLISDALGVVPDRSSALSCNASFRKEFHEMVTVTYSDYSLEGFVGVIRLAWAVHLMLIHDGNHTREAISLDSSNDMGYINSCLTLAFAKNVFQFLLDNVLRTAGYLNDDEDMLYMYNAYLHKMITCFLSQPLARDKVKEAKDTAASVLTSASRDHIYNDNRNTSQVTGVLPFVSLLEFVGELYQKEPELVSGNDVLWTFANFAGEDHTNFETLVAFLNLLSTLAYNPDGSKKVYELLKGKTFRAVGWTTLFDCLTTYDLLFKEALQTPASMLPDFPEADAKALVAYLNILRKVIENGGPSERKNWFPDIEPLFKLLSYENVPSYVKGALREAIATFARVSPALKDNIWSYLEQYDLPVGTNVGNGQHKLPQQVYDMQYELNDIEARRERYPSTISFINLLNTLIAEEKDLSDGGQRFVGIFRFICDHVFGPYPQRAYADSCEKWQLVVACLENFNLMINMYDISDEDFVSALEQYQLSTMPDQSSHHVQIPVVELMKDFMSGKTVFRNIMGILVAGVDFIISERTSQLHGKFLEKAVQLSLDILIHVLNKDHVVSDLWRPLYQPLDVVLAQDPNQIVSLLEYVRYGLLPQIQLSSIKIMKILSSRMSGIVQLLLKANAADSLVEDYAYCLELRSEESQTLVNRTEDPAILIMQLLIDNVGRPAPNVTHLLLRFDLQSPVERTVLQPKFYYSCLKVILETLEELEKPDTNAPIHEFGLQLLYELCVDPVTSEPTMALLSSKRFYFFVKHLESLGVSPLPKRNANQPLRISSLHQRAWLLKLLAVELHMCDFGMPSHQEACQSILSSLFSRELRGRNFGENATQSICKSKVLELLEVIQFRPADFSSKLFPNSSESKYNLMVENILADPLSTRNGVYHYSERGDRLIDLTVFSEKLWKNLNAHHSDPRSEADLNDMRESIQNILRWGWKYNRNVEEQAAQLHMLTGWSHIVEVSVSRRSSHINNRSQVLYQILDSSVTASASPDCSLKMAFVLTQVALTCMAKLRDERFLCLNGLAIDGVSTLEMLIMKHLSNGACHSILYKLILAIMRSESSEALRRRQYALMLSYFQYCRHTVDPDIPQSVLRLLLNDEQDSDNVELQKIDGEQAELARANFLILIKEAKPLVDLVINDATQGSERGKTMALYVLDAFVCIDHDNFFLMQLQRKGIINSCLSSINNIAIQDVGLSLDHLQQACIVEAEITLLLRICHRYGKSGMQILFSMGILENINLSKVFRFQGIARHFDRKLYKHNGGGLNEEIDYQRMILTPMLRLAFTLTALVDSSNIFEVNSKIVREFLSFIGSHRLLFDQILREDVFEADEALIEPVYLAVGILSKVWPHDESGDFGFVQRLFSMMRSIFTRTTQDLFSSCMFQKKRKLEVSFLRLHVSLSSYLYYLVSKKSLKLQLSESPPYSPASGLQQPTLASISQFLGTVASNLERSVDEKSLLHCKIRDVTELSRQEVDEIINAYAERDGPYPADDLQKRRHVAMRAMCEAAGHADEMISVLVLVAEHLLNVVLAHSRDGWGAASDDPWGKLVPTLDRLEHLKEEKVGGDLKLFKRLVASLKESALLLAPP